MHARFPTSRLFSLQFLRIAEVNFKKKLFFWFSGIVQKLLVESLSKSWNQQHIYRQLQLMGIEGVRPQIACADIFLGSV